MILEPFPSFLKGCIIKLNKLFIEDNEKEWKLRLEEVKKYIDKDEEEFKLRLEEVKKYIDKNNKLPPAWYDEYNDIYGDGYWISLQKKNYKKNQQIMSNPDIRKLWEAFITEYQEYIDKNNELPLAKYSDYCGVFYWISVQKKNYKKNQQIMSNPDIRKLWEEFINEYQEYFPDNHAIPTPSKKSITIVINKNIKKETDKERRVRISYEYQELTKKMVIQKSETTFNMFKKEPKLWEQYHDARDFSFKGYDQLEVPVNKIIKYLETKKNHRLKILDLGCGRNYIKEYFKDNKKFTITGYDYISCNGSKVADISNLEDEEDETIDVCIYSQSLMGNNWKGYLDEGKRILRYNGEMIISESSERYEIIKDYLVELDMKIINEEYDKNKRWFYINVIKQ